MFEVGKYVVYGTTGVCQVCAISPLNFGQEGLYYTLHVVHDPQNNLIYAPVTSVESGKVMLRDMISREEAGVLLSHLPAEPLEWIPDLRKRNESYTHLLSLGKAVDWARLMVRLYQKQKEKLGEQRTLPRRDRELLNLAEKLFYGEIAVVLGQDIEDIKQKFLALLEKSFLDEKDERVESAAL